MQSLIGGNIQGTLNEASSFSHQREIKPPKKYFNLVIGLVGLIVFVVLVIFMVSLFKPKYEILSKPGSTEIVAYLPKSAANHGNVTGLINKVKKETDAIKAKNNAKANVLYSLRVFDDKAVAQKMASGSIGQQMAKLNPVEKSAYMSQIQKDQRDHLIFVANSATKWQVIYGTNYQSLKNSK